MGLGRDRGVKGSGLRFRPVEAKNLTFYIFFFCLSVLLSSKGDKLREGLLTATPYL